MSHEGRHLAVIPARGGSKRLPRKNVIDFFGRPIIAYTIAAAQEARVFDRVLVSTEDREIAETARQFGAEIDSRPAALGADDASINQVCLELLDRLAKNGQVYDSLTVLYATAPLRNAADIRATFKLLEPGYCDFAMAVAEFDRPFHQALRIAPDGAATPVFADLAAQRADPSQKYVAGNGSTYCATVRAFKQQGNFYGSPLKGHLMPPSRSVDIDTANDLALAMYYYRAAADKIGPG